MRAALLGCLAGGGISSATWTAGFGSFSNGNRSVSLVSQGNSYASTAAKTGGNWYAELRFIGAVYLVSVGFVVDSATYNTAMLGNAHYDFGFACTPGGSGEKIAAGVYNNTAQLTNNPAGYSDNDVLMLAINMGNGRMWWGRNGSWLAGNPGAGTGAMATYSAGAVGSMFVACTLFSSIADGGGGGSFTIVDLLTYQPPAGFEPL